MEDPITLEVPPPSDGRECQCPPWVVRCVHFAETLLVLADGKTNLHPESCHKFAARNEPAVGLIEEWVACTGCGIPLGSGTPFFFPDLASAEAEFHKREQELLHAS